MKELKLTKGQTTIVDDEDYVRLLEAGKWCMNGPYAYNVSRGFLHRFLLGLPRGSQGVKGRHKVQVDHINHDKLDNRRSNLRVVTITQNARNRKPVGNSYSMFKGAHYDSHRSHWLSRIRVDGRLIHLGVFDTDLEAATAYNKAASYYFGEHASLNDLSDATPSSLKSRERDQSKAHKPRKHPLPFTL